MVAKAQPASKKQHGNGKSPIADLPSRMTTESAKAGKNLKQLPNFTGQYFLDRFVTGKDQQQEERTKMDIVRQAVKVLDVAAMKKNLDDMVTMASQIDEKAGYTKDNKTLNKGPTYKNAANIRSILLACFGAMKFAAEPLKKAGFTDETGFHNGAAIARKVLKDTQIKWDGTKAEDTEEREQRLMMKREERALANIKKAMPRQPGQSIVEYENKCLGLLKNQMQKDLLEEKQTQIAKQIDNIMAMGDELAQAIADGIVIALQEKADAKAGKKASKATKPSEEPALV